MEEVVGRVLGSGVLAELEDAARIVLSSMVLAEAGLLIALLCAWSLASWLLGPRRMGFALPTCPNCGWQRGADPICPVCRYAPGGNPSAPPALPDERAWRNAGRNEHGKGKKR
jgi:hypothetical protein